MSARAYEDYLPAHFYKYKSFQWQQRPPVVHSVRLDTPIPFVYLLFKKKNKFVYTSTGRSSSMIRVHGKVL